MTTRPLPSRLAARGLATLLRTGVVGALTALAALGVGLAASAPARAETLLVTVDRAKVVRLPERTATIVIGNPIIADVTVQKNGVMVVTGKSYGQTNLIAMDASGAILNESLLRVQAAVDEVVTVQRGLERESYSCTPTCQPSISLGDDTKYFEEAGSQAGRRNSLAGQR